MFLDPHDYPFMALLEASWRIIRDECVALPHSSFEPWVQRDMYSGEGWSVYGLIAFGKRLEGGLRACPRTAEIVSKVTGLSTVGFSRLTPGAHITPHVGWVKTVYRGHLGLVVPPASNDCAIRVGPETRSWREGECLAFADTVEHEAWNRTTVTRTVLLFDFPRPGCEDSPQDEPPVAVARAIRERS
jgi:ornithine lipid ester-linked acyl 2-hydroxylase